VYAGFSKLDHGRLGGRIFQDTRDARDRLQDQGLCPLDVIAVADAQVVLQSAFVEGRGDDYRLSGQVGVGNDDSPAIVCLHHSRARLDVLDGPLEVIHDDLVANPEGLSEQQDTGQEVLKMSRKAKPMATLPMPSSCIKSSALNDGRRRPAPHSAAPCLYSIRVDV
jgi:hypothetical protein